MSKHGTSYTMQNRCLIMGHLRPRTVSRPPAGYRALFLQFSTLFFKFPIFLGRVSTKIPRASHTFTFETISRHSSNKITILGLRISYSFRDKHYFVYNLCTNDLFHFLNMFPPYRYNGLRPKSSNSNSNPSSNSMSTPSRIHPRRAIALKGFVRL